MTTLWDLRTGIAKRAYEQGTTVDAGCCELCGRKVRGDGYFLEVSIDGYPMFADSPHYDPNESQGEFRFGPDCKAKILRTFAPWLLDSEDRNCNHL